MADSSLSVGTSTGGQDPVTQNNLQPSAGSGTDTSSSLTNNFQPGIASDQLKSNQGIPLTPTALSTVSLSGTSAGTTLAQTQPAKHKINPVMLGVSVIFFVAAVVIFIMIHRSGKKHNQY